MTINWSKLSKTLKPKTIGMLEEVSLPMFGVDDITAKVDTGAYSGSLHATSIKELVKDKSKVLSFKPHGKTTAVTVNKFHIPGTQLPRVDNVGPFLLKEAIRERVSAELTQLLTQDARECNRKCCEQHVRPRV